MSMKRALSAIRAVRPETGVSSHLHRIIACEERLEEAIHFLVKALDEKAKRGKKPVVLHSIRVAWLLLEMGYPTDVVLAGLLHDVLEKTNLTASQIGRKFGVEVGLMVAAATNDPRIDDAMERYQDSLARCAAYGDGALVIRAADLMDNCDRLSALGSVGRLERVAGKLRMLVKISREHRLDERLVDELVKRLRRINRKVAGLALVSKKAHSGGKTARLSYHNK